MSNEETVTEYRVNVPAFLLWPIHVVAWLVATVIRAAVLVLLVVAAIALYGWWQDHNATAPPTRLAPVCAPLTTST